MSGGLYTSSALAMLCEGSSRMILAVACITPFCMRSALSICAPFVVLRCATIVESLASLMSVRMSPLSAIGFVSPCFCSHSLPWPASCAALYSALTRFIRSVMVSAPHVTMSAASPSASAALRRGALPMPLLPT